MSELSIINQKAGPLGETVKKDFSDFAGGNPFAKSVKNSSAMGLDDDITGQSLQGKIPSPLSPSDVGPSKLEYPVDVSGNPAYAATIKFQVLEYTTASPGKSQKNHITPTTDNIKSQETTKAKVEDETAIPEIDGVDPLVSNLGNYEIDGVSTGIGNPLFQPSDAAVTESFVKTKEDAKKEFNNVKNSTTNSGNFKLGFFPKQNSPIITMYFPPSQAFVDGVSYGDATLGAFGGAALAGIEAGGTGIRAAGDQIKSEAKSFIDTFFKGQLRLSAAAESEAARLAASRAIERNPLTNLNSGLGAAAGIANRIIVNPNVRKLFNGVIVREFTFQFKMIPTSPEEGEVIQKIIKIFRKELYPRAFKVPIGDEANVSLGYNFPNAFKIKFNFKDSENRNIPKILPCYLRNMSHTINPTGGGFKNDGKPNETDLTLSFVEHRAIEQQDIEKGF